MTKATHSPARRLVTRWRREAAILRRWANDEPASTAYAYGFHREAEAYEACAKQLLNVLTPAGGTAKESEAK